MTIPTVERYHLSPDATIVVGLSGGADSVALAHLLKTTHEGNVVACHINHCLRGEESERDCAFVQAFCDKWKIPLVVYQVDVQSLAKTQRLGVEECARKVRYDCFEETAKRFSENSYIATAHTTSDNAETLLFNLMRGTGIAGLAGIPPVRGNIIRPLLRWTREQIEAYCMERSLDYVTDSTNLSTDYTRNRIRHQVIPLLEEICDGAQEHIAKTAQYLRADYECLHSLATELKKQAQDKQGPTPEAYRLAVLEMCNDAVLTQLCFLFLKEQECEISAYRVEELKRLILKKSGKVQLQETRFAVAEKGYLFVYDSISRTMTPFEFSSFLKNGEKEYDFESLSGHKYKIKSLETSEWESFNKVYKNLFAIYMDCGKICGSVILRSRLPNDKLRLAGTKHTKPLKKLFQEQGIDRYTRRDRFIVADDDGVIAIEGLGVAERVCCDKKTKRVLVITEC